MAHRASRARAQKKVAPKKPLPGVKPQRSGTRQPPQAKATPAKTGPRRLRAVGDGEAPSPPEKVKSISQAARDGSERELLVAIRDRIAETVERADCPPRDLASLTKRLQDIRKEIALLDATSKQPESASRQAHDVDDKFDSSVI
jgi:hypothetical protein